MNLKHIIHNFVNPHQQLKEKTPAEKAGIELELELELYLGEQKLLNLIRHKAKMEMTKR